MHRKCQVSLKFSTLPSALFKQVALLFSTLNLSKIYTLGRSEKCIANYAIILLCSTSKKCLVKN